MGRGVDNKKPRTVDAGFQVLACDCTCATYPVKCRVVVVVQVCCSLMRAPPAMVAVAGASSVGGKINMGRDEHAPRALVNRLAGCARRFAGTMHTMKRGYRRELVETDPSNLIRLIPA